MTLTIDIRTGQDTLLPKLKQALDSLKDTRPLMDSLAEDAMERIMYGFEKHIDPDGEPWEPVTTTYAKWKRKKKKDPENILIFRAILRRSIRPQVTKRSVRIGTNEKYAAIHNYGGIINIPARQRVLHFKKKGKKSRFAKTKKATYGMKVQGKAYQVNMPKREFLGIGADLQDDMVQTINDYLRKATT